MPKFLVLLLVLLCFANPVEASELRERDAKLVKLYRDGLQSTHSFCLSRPDLFPSSKLKQARLLTREQKEGVWTTWKMFLDYLLALDSLRHSHHGFLKLRGSEKVESFLIYYSAYLTQYRYALQLLAAAGNDPALETVLNEPVPEIGLPRGTYSSLSSRFLRPEKGGAFAVLQVIYKTMREKVFPDLRILIAQDSKFILDFGKGKGEKMAARHAVETAQGVSFSAIFPVQSGVSEWMGDTKVYRRTTSLVTQDQIRSMLPKLEPGDILLERREWYLSNIGLPGFWPHAALYIGTPEQRKSYFEDAETMEWVRSRGQTDGSLDSLLRLRYSKAYTAGVTPYLGHHPRILEAMSEGVTFTSLEHSAEADSVAVLRPRLSKREKAIAIYRAFHYAGRPYDFNFDFQTDSSLVCTELIYKSYEPSAGMQGLKMPVVEILGRHATPANELVKQFDSQFGTPSQQSDLIWFLDGKEQERRAVEATLADFRESWKRPKWHILQPQ
jgi:hypothetical protein